MFRGLLLMLRFILPRRVRHLLGWRWCYRRSFLPVILASTILIVLLQSSLRGRTTQYIRTDKHGGLTQVSLPSNGSDYKIVRPGRINVVEPKLSTNDLDGVTGPRAPGDTGWSDRQRASPRSVSHKLAVIVPYRDSAKELSLFVPYIHMYLNSKQTEHRIYVINQVDRYRFNRGSLVNVGFIESRGECDYMAMHDVDLLPVNLNITYVYPKTGPFHLTAPEFHPMYHYENFIGGIFLITYSQYTQLNGMSNRYWGWGREDDEFFKRITEAGLKIRRPENITSGQQTFFHIHDPKERKRDYSQYFNQWKETSGRDNVTGLDTLQYSVKSRRHLALNGAPYTQIDVALECNITVTPWCLQPEDHHKIKASDKDVLVADLLQKMKQRSNILQKQFWKQQTKNEMAHT